MGFLRKLLIISFAVLILNNFGFLFSSYVFQVKDIKDEAWRYSGVSYTSSNLRKAFSQLYPEYVLKEKEFPWIPCNTGGLHGSVTLLYASFTEFLAIYHAELETTGSTGRHYMNISVSVLQGTLSESKENLAPSKTYYEGENHVFRMGKSSIIKLTSGTSLLIYGRGFLPLTMGYWISETLLVHFDILLVVTTLWFYIKAVALSHVAIWKWINDFIAGFMESFRIWNTTSLKNDL